MEMPGWRSSLLRSQQVKLGKGKVSRARHIPRVSGRAWVYYEGYSYAATVLEIKPHPDSSGFTWGRAKLYVRYVGYKSSENEWVPAGKLTKPLLKKKGTKNHVPLKPGQFTWLFPDLPHGDVEEPTPDEKIQVPETIGSVAAEALKNTPSLLKQSMGRFGVHRKSPVRRRIVERRGASIPCERCGNSINQRDFADHVIQCFQESDSTTEAENEEDEEEADVDDEEEDAAGAKDSAEENEQPNSLDESSDSSSDASGAPFTRAGAGSKRKTVRRPRSSPNGKKQKTVEIESAEEKQARLKQTGREIAAKLRRGKRKFAHGVTADPLVKDLPPPPRLSDTDMDLLPPYKPALLPRYNADAELVVTDFRLELLGLAHDNGSPERKEDLSDAASAPLSRRVQPKRRAKRR